MRIISSGENSIKYVYIANINCPNCRTLFEFERSEATAYLGNVYQVKCPMCGRGIFFDNSAFKKQIK